MTKTIVVTGATGVLGNLVAKTFAERGHNIALLDKDQTKLDSLVRDLNLPNERLYAQTIDLLDDTAVHDSAEAVLSKFGSVHALIHLVGGWTGGKTLPESSKDDFESMLKSCFRVPEDNETGEWLICSDVFEVLHERFPMLISNLSTKIRIGQSLKLLGCKMKHTKKGQAYLLVRI